jgi:nitrogen fixation NifU-like protein
MPVNEIQPHTGFFKGECGEVEEAIVNLVSPTYTRYVFNDSILDHFKNPRNAGDLSGATATVEVSNPVCGDVMRLAAKMENGRISESRFKTQGCVVAIAASSVLTELINGRSVPEAKSITAERISEALGGLPPATFHAAQLCTDAVKALAAKLG